jgi:2-haloacid dehalogenase
VFIDDSPANVAAAADAGLDAILFTDTGHLRTDLRGRGLPV